MSTNERIDEQLGVTGITAVIGADNVYAGDHRVGAAVRRAYDDALAWVAASRERGDDGADGPRTGEPGDFEKAD